MNLPLAEARALGARILNADKDAFGLTTDGRGNVVIPKNITAMHMITSLPFKYVLFADSVHETSENLFSSRNVEVLQQAGVKRVFLENNEEDKEAIEQAILSTKPLRKNSNFIRQSVPIYKALRAAGIEPVTSDSRIKFRSQKDVTYLEENIAALQVTKNTLASLTMDADGKSIPEEFHENLLSNKAATNRSFELLINNCVNKIEKMPNKDSTDYNAALQDCRSICQLYLTIDRNTAAGSAIEDRKCYALASDTLATLGHLDALESGLSANKNPLQTTREDIVTLLDKYQQRVTLVKQNLDADAKRDATGDTSFEDPQTVARVFRDSEKDIKTALHWGIGHTDKTNDLDQLLGKDKTLVVATVGSKNELKFLLNRIQKGCWHGLPVSDPPDYIYFPAKKDGGKDRLVSVAEYFTAHPELEKRTPCIPKTNIKTNER